ncbi:hypothetical protein CDAR_101561 [Caerostris darwini]|uniref:Uncharacterized protein n=1 Tax=Caerostris darwini TaxID=1538125 RepID=A0AAV4SWD0_9ARAC|nr:hypothetical protein CDAR_101561 [Caerostris darwini]
MQRGFERQRDGIKISETHLTRHQFLLDRKCPRDTSPVFTGTSVSSRHITIFYSTVSVLETHHQFLLDRKCPRDTSAVFTRPAQVQSHGAPFTAQNITVREWKSHCASFTAQNNTLCSCKP